MLKKEESIYLKKKNIKIKFKYTRDEYIKSRRKFILESKTISKGNIAFLIFMTILEIFFLMTKELFFGIIVGVLLILSYIMITVLYFIQPKKVYDISKLLKEEMELEFDDRGIKFKIKDNNSIIPWDNVYEVWESKEYIFLMQSKISYILIPKRAFKNEADVLKVQRVFEDNNIKYKNIK